MNLVSALTNAASNGNTGITFVHGTGFEEKLSYRDIYRSALRILYTLQDAGMKAGDELVIQVEEDKWLLCLFWACLFGGIIPVPLSVGVQPEQRKKLFKIWKHLSHPFLFCDPKQFQRIEPYLKDPETAEEHDLTRGRIMFLAEIADNEREGQGQPILDSDIAYVQFSSGSTGDPKGVTLTHDNLICNITDIIKSLEIRDGDILLSWMPMTHDMGMIGFHLCGVLKNVDVVSIPTHTFIRRPLIWMDKASEHRASVLYSPNFGLQYFLSALEKNQPAGWDLSCIRIIINGAEPISAQLCEQFTQSLQRHGLRAKPFVTAYGLAEACVEVSAMPPDTAIRSYHLHRNFLNPGQRISLANAIDISTATFVDVGYPVDSCHVRLCDDKDSVLPEDTIGHIQIRGRNVTAGYYNYPAGATELFTPDNWLRTGDLGFLREGRLVVTGRRKNIIVINGQNYYPQDIERVIIEAGLSELGKVVACGADGTKPGEGNLIVFCLYKGGEENFISIARTIRELVVANIGIYADSIIPVKKIPKTTSGKIQHFELLEQYRNGNLKNFARWEDRDEHHVHEPVRASVSLDSMIETLLVVSRSLLGQSDLDMETDLFEAGMNSLIAMQLAARIRQMTGAKIGVADIFRHNTIAGIGSSLLTAEMTEDLPLLRPTAVSSCFDLSEAQRRIWTEYQLDKSSVAYNIPVLFRLEGSFNTGQLERAMRGLLRKYEILRTSFVLNEDTPVQKVHPYEDTLFSIGYDDYRQVPNSLQKGIETCKREVDTPFDLDVPCQFRIRTVHLAENKYYLLFVIHHILADGWSLSRLLQELCAFYNATEQNSVDALSEDRSVQYRDYVQWQKEMLAHTGMGDHCRYWIKELEGLPEPANLVNRKKISPGGISFRVNHYSRSFPAEDFKMLKDLSARFDTTPFGILMSLLAVLIHRYTGQKDIVMAFDAAGRMPGEMEDLRGYTLNTLCLRVPVGGNLTFSEVVTTVTDKLLAAIDHQWYPFEKILDNKEINRGGQGNDLFRILVLYQNFYQKNYALGLTGCKMEQEEVFVKDGFVDLQVEFHEKKEGLEMCLQYRDTLYDSVEMQQLADHFQNLLHAVADKLSEKIGEYEFLTEIERKFLMPVHGSTTDVISVRVPIHVLFERRAANFPDAIAIYAGNNRLSYCELNRRANNIAHFMKDRYHVRPDDRIGFLVTRNENIVIAMLAILKAGAAYVAIDPELPMSRCKQMVVDSDIKCLLTDEDNIPPLMKAFDEGFLIQMDGQKSGFEVLPDLLFEGTMNNLAYVIYTSGSTGQPKGVMIEHRSLSDYVRYFIEYFDIDSSDIFIQQASVGFDTIIEEIFPALCTSAGIVMAEKGGRDIDELLALIARNNVTVLTTTPLVLKEINARVDSRIASLRLVISGGDMLRSSDIDHLFNNVEIFNTYGPCEATVCVTYKRINMLSDTVLIGNPICNHRVYILDEYGKPMPWGRSGEMYLEGGLARGYLNLPELTETKFIESPFEPGKKLFRSGDIGRFTSTGELEFTGRGDNQFKIRGYRIEPEEIENIVSLYPGINRVAVVPHKEGNNMLAYLTVQDNFSPDQLRIYISQYLPSYMMPSGFEVIDRMPFTTSGKIDRLKLMEKAGESGRLSAMPVDPVSPLQEKLLQLIKPILAVENIGITDNLFEHGCNSIKATRIIGALYKKLQYKMGIRDLFIYPTIALLAERLDELEKLTYFPIPKAEETEMYELSHAQQRLWLLSRVDKSSFAYNEGELYEIRGRIDPDKIRDAFDIIVKRHDILRTVFREADGLPRQVIRDDLPVVSGFSYNDVSESPDPVAFAEEILNEQAKGAFDFEIGPLYRIALIRLSGEKHFFSVVMHHIITDDWSARLLINEFLRIYGSLEKGIAAELPVPKLQYKDYVCWMNNVLRQDHLSREMNYWKGIYKDGVPILDLPLDYHRPAVKRYEGNTVFTSIDPVILSGLDKFSQERGASLFMSLLCGLSVLLARYTGQFDFVIGSPVAGREHPDLDHIPGFFINMLPLRVRFDPKDNLSDLLQKLRQLCLEAYQSQSYPFDRLINDLHINRDRSRSPIFDILLNLRVLDKTEGELDVDGIRFEKRNKIAAGCKYDLSFYFERQEEVMSLAVEYDRHLFSTDRIDRMIVHYKNILKAMTGNAVCVVEELDYLSGQEKEQLTGHFNNTKVIIPDTGILSHFHRQVVDNPDRRCIVCEGRSLSYRQVNDYADKLAGLMIARYHIQENDLVGLFPDRSEQVVIFILAVWKAGAIYVPIGTDFPPDRIAFIIRDAGVALVLTDTRNLPLCARLNGIISFPVLSVETAALPEEYAGSPGAFRPNGDIAYVMYTSGSTGEPKAVEIYHHAVLNTLNSLKDRPGFGGEDVMLSVSTCLFDISVSEFFLPLTTGGSLIIASRDEVMDMRRLKELFERVHPTYMQATPALWNSLVDAGWRGDAGLKAITCGEVLSGELAGKLLPCAGQLWNLYGPTEATIFATGKQILAADEGITIGYPLSNTTVYILDEAKQIVPIGVFGEIHIGGKGVAKGYLNRPELTRLRFLDELPGLSGRVYITGDIGRWLPDGTIEYRGRRDHQVKVRGYRIEIGEIEHCILQYDGLRAAAVQVRDGDGGDKKLVVFVVFPKEYPYSEEGLRRHLQQRLPGYMIPALFIRLDEMPLTVSGKIDRKALLSKDLSVILHPGAREIIPATTSTEKMLLAIWEVLLDRKDIGITDNFFDLGGHSLTANQLVNRIYRQTGVEIGLSMIFQLPTVKEMGGVLAQLENDKYNYVELV